MELWAIAVIIAIVVLWLWKRQYNRPPLLILPQKIDSPKRVRLHKKQLQILVTGGAGNLGAQLIRVLLQEHGARVGQITVCDMVAGRETDPRVTYVKGDITNFGQMLELTQNQDIVYHMASLIDLRSAPRHWNRIYNINVVGTHNIIEACVANGVAALVYTGSTAARLDAFTPHNEQFRAEINEEGENNIFDRKLEDLCSFYGKTKNMAERAIIAANGRNGMATASVMPCVVFGYKDRFQMDQHFPSILEGKPMDGVMRVDTDESGIVAWSFNESCARLHVLCGEALLDEHRRKDIGGQSFFAADFQMSYFEGHQVIDRELQKASKGKCKPRKKLFQVLPRPLVYIIGFFASIVDWFYDGNVRKDVFNLAYFYAIKAYATSDLSCDNSRSIKMLGFKPMSAEASCRAGALKYFPQ